MLKKLLLVAVLAGVATVAIKGTRAGRMVKTEVSSLRDWADDQIPVEEKIKQMRHDVANLDRDVERAKSELAKEIVEVRDLTNKLGAFRAQIQDENKSLVQRGSDLKDATEKVSVGKLIVPVGEAKDRLKRDVALHVKKKEQLASLERTLASRERIRDTLAKQLDSMAKQKYDMTTQIDAVEAEYKTLQLAQIESKYQNDDTRLSKVKEDLAALQKKLDIEKEKLNLAPVGREETAGIGSTQSVDEILAPLSGAKPTAGDEAHAAE